YASYSQGYRVPAFLELTCAGPGAVCPGLQGGVAPDPPLNAVTATNYEVGMQARPFPWLDIDVSLYRTDVSDDIFSVSPTGTTGVFFQNGGQTRREGGRVGPRGRGGRAPAAAGRGARRLPHLRVSARHVRGPDRAGHSASSRPGDCARGELAHSRAPPPPQCGPGLSALALAHSGAGRAVGQLAVPSR